MVDTGCLCLLVIDEALVRKENIYCKNISPGRLRLADMSKVMRISLVACVKMDIDGRQEMIWGYVMPKLAYFKERW